MGGGGTGRFCNVSFFLLIEGSRHLLISSAVVPPLTLSEQVSVYLELASIYNQLENTQEAVAVIRDATDQFSGTTEEFRFSLSPNSSLLPLLLLLSSLT